VSVKCLQSRFSESIYTVEYMYRVTQEIEFCYGHRLLDYDGKCRHLHGHNGKAVIVLEGEKLDHRGMLIDFTDIKKKLRCWIEDNLDHRMILSDQDPVLELLQNAGEPLYVIDENPTAETIARIIFEQAREQKLPVVEVRLWETSKSCASYRA
jgi:6-pyruvoyltetrahydropterin/6-carboxytetrahydropterin synthase